jgi:hypothetical protein
MGKVVSLHPENHIFQCQLVQQNGQAAIYFAFENELHHIPNPTIFNNVFKSEMWSGYRKMAALPLPIGNSMTNAELIKDGAAIYLTYDNTSFHISSMDVFNKCGFNS